MLSCQSRAKYTSLLTVKELWGLTMGSLRTATVLCKLGSSCLREKGFGVKKTQGLEYRVMYVCGKRQLITKYIRIRRKVKEYIGSLA